MKWKKEVADYKNMAYDNPIIKQRFEEKMRRLDRTSQSILISWAINNAVQLMTEKSKESLTPKELKDWLRNAYPVFIDLYTEWMEENSPGITANPPPLEKLNLTQEELTKKGKEWNEELQEKYNEMSEQTEQDRQDKEAKEPPLPIINLEE
jgi:hypothetical protein